MKRLKGDILWAALLGAWLSLILVPVLRGGFIAFTEAHAYIAGFIKFFVLASMGDMLGGRILYGEWRKPRGFIYKAIVWGVLGMMITLVFTVFFKGAEAAMAAGRLPFYGSTFALAFFGSTVMNVTFGPMLYVYHKFADQFVELKLDGVKNISVKMLVEKIDWYGLVSFNWLKNCLLIWVPMHTLVFLLPSVYRVVASAYLSILLGILIALSKKGNTEVKSVVQEA